MICFYISNVSNYKRYLHFKENLRFFLIMLECSLYCFVNVINNRLILDNLSNSF